MKTSGLKIIQWGLGEGVEETPLYLTSMNVSDLARAKIDRWSRTNREGYQRAPKDSRFRPKGKRSIVSYLLRESGVFPTSVLLNIRGTIDFKPEKQLSKNIELGEITLPDDEEYWIIDGQHRINALQRAIAQEPSFRDYPVPVTLTNTTDKFDEMLNFYIVNSRQYKIPTDLVYRHLQSMQEKAVLERKKWLEVAILGEKEERAALATMVVDFLEDDDASPFKGRIQFTGEDREDYHLFKDYSLSSWIARILHETAFSNLDYMTLAELLADYWAVIKELHPKSFSDFKAYTLLKSTGLASFTYLFPTIFAMCASEGEVNRERFKYYLEMLQEKVDLRGQVDTEFERPMDDEWWSRANGPAIASATGNKTCQYIMKSMAKKINIAKGNR